MNVIQIIQSIPNPYPDIHGVAYKEDADRQALLHQGYEQMRTDAIAAVSRELTVQMEAWGLSDVWAASKKAKP